jgi:hypothetical protein
MFIAVDLKVIEGLAAAVGRAGAMSEDAVLAGLVRLWHRCWADEADIFTGDEIAGMFAFDASRADGSARAVGALVAFGFLESKGPNWRVRGAARYLRLKASRRRGGQLAKRNLKRGQSPGSRAGDEPETSRDTPPAPPGSYTESPSHRVTEIDVPKPKRERKPSAAEDFFGWLNATRATIKSLEPQPKPPASRLNKNFGEALLQVGRPELEGRYRTFLGDSTNAAKDPPWPWEVFAATWSWRKAQQAPQPRSKFLSPDEIKNLYASQEPPRESTG